MVTISDDCKIALEATGIGTAASIHCCMFCELPRDQFNNPEVMFVGGTLRSFANIEKKALEYQAEAAKHKGKQKLSSAPWQNCEGVPLCLPTDGQKDVLVIDCLCPMVSKSISKLKGFKNIWIIQFILLSRSFI